MVKEEDKTMITKRVMKEIKAQGHSLMQIGAGAEIALRRYEDITGEEQLSCSIAASDIDTRLANIWSVPYTEDKEEINTFVKCCIKNYGEQLTAHLTTLFNKSK